MKTVYIIHGWAGSSKGNWFPWIKKELEKRNVRVFVFDMPDAKHPSIESWVKYLEDNVKDADENAYFIGHSVGCQTILRFLEKLHKHKKVGGCFLVAGWFNIINLSSEEL